MNVDLRARTENDAVAVDDVDAAERAHLPEDLRRRAGRIGHAVEHGPVRRLLLELDRRVAPDVERLPVQDGFGLRLRDVETVYFPFVTVWVKVVLAFCHEVGVLS